MDPLIPYRGKHDRLFLLCLLRVGLVCDCWELCMRWSSQGMHPKIQEGGLISQSASEAVQCLELLLRAATPPPTRPHRLRTLYMKKGYTLRAVRPHGATVCKGREYRAQVGVPPSRLQRDKIGMDKAMLLVSLPWSKSRHPRHLNGDMPSSRKQKRNGQYPTQQISIAFAASFCLCLPSFHRLCRVRRSEGFCVGGFS